MLNRLFIVFLICFSFNASAQKKDLIVLNSGDSLACLILNEDESSVTAEIKEDWKKIEKEINRAEIRSISNDVIRNRNIYRKRGSSLILETRKGTRELEFIPRNGIMLGTDFIFTLSASYERIQPLGKYIALVGRGGGGITFESGEDPAAILNVSFIGGTHRNYAEVGLGGYYPHRFAPIYNFHYGYRYIGFKGLSVRAFLKTELYTSQEDIDEWGKGKTYHHGVGFQIGYRWRF